ncbi:hypothetical protein HMPREF0058_0091 [Actinomyces urogenitalis DSM 15434]|uniref:Glycosyl hydrolase family 2, sugar binding domain protein n=4 Tax=root TaxID=1 RepID=C0W2J7_9ACTO|nr:glycosyl hydrolase [Actinomyces urogenitalis]EEH67100.1 hypothetical protein HMPREF0058_0091 [Actinomyces urogenitalis DSM 15434]MDK8237039.1 glycosyl hydrolase [Actinomyces urogenitalis]MDK8836034.1 glycosyl hydrolase [Actinomyces urogenitalis]WOO94403.1 glycosyl hydrolase [Actinomyces urogenitalis]
MTLVDQLRARLKDPGIEYRPEQRWWLAAGLHTDATIRHEIEQAHRLGFGGMEFLAMPEDGIDESRYGWGSEEWTHDSVTVARETTERSMSFSFTSGTNWSNANLPTITPDDDAAAQELGLVYEDVTGTRRGPLPTADLSASYDGPDTSFERIPGTRQRFVAVVAAVVTTPEDGPARIDVSTLTNLTDLVTGSGQERELTWSAPDSRSWRLFIFWQHGTGQIAKPSASVNYTVNYLERDGVDAVIDYWREVVLTDELKEIIARNPRAQMYMDSLELNLSGEAGMFWGRTVADEFATRRGYDIIPWLPVLVSRAPLRAVSTVYTFEPLNAADAVTVAKVRHDYVETLTDLYIENMLLPFKEFLNSYGISLRSEISYGLPFELTRPGIAVDGIENESLEFGSQIDAYRLMAGAAHLLGKQYSSETGATTRNHMLDHRFYDQIINTQLAAGITKTVLHGWSSPRGAEGTTHWPGHEGMLPLFSERFDTRQPAAEFYPLWTQAVGRMQYLLRQGRPRIDVGILRTDHFTDNGSGMVFFDAEGRRVADEELYGRHWMRARENHWWVDLGMQDAGWTYEFFDGSYLLRPEVRLGEGTVQPEGPGYQALIVYQEALSAEVAARLVEVARTGVKVLIVNGVTELAYLAAGRYTHHERAASRTPGLDGRDEELAAAMAQLRALDTVAEIDDQSQTLNALRALGVRGYHELTQANENVLTYEREDGDLLHVYVYHYLYETGEPTTVELRLPGHGTAYRLDAWTGTLTEVPSRAQGEDTLVPVSLRPGEPAIITLDRSAASGSTAAPVSPELATAVVSRTPQVLAELTHWDITVESWDAGEDEVIEEDRGLGYVTREVVPHTEVTAMHAASDRLAPWCELDGVGTEVSGVGEYRATVRLDALPAGRVLLDLGNVGGGLSSVSINGSEPVGADTSAPVAEVTGLLRQGDNEVVVRVSSSLSNRLKARGYYDALPDVALMLAGGEPRPHQVPLRGYGLQGPVRLVQG